MDLDKLKSIVEKIAGHPALSDRIQRYREDRPADNSKLLEAIQSTLTVIATGTAFIGGPKTKQVGAMSATIALLIELSVIIKRDVIEDPEIQQMFKSAWAELEEQSATAAATGKALIAQAQEFVASKVPSLKKS